MKKLLFILFVIKCIDGVPRDPFLAKTPVGEIRGLPGYGNYSMFLGVPFALVDENNPFGPAIPHPGFNETFEAFNDEVKCPQINRNTFQGKIQCLQLNIYVPTIGNFEEKLPVMVYLYGGAFVQGSKKKTIYTPNFLVRHNVIVVAISYRLGPYGFLCLSVPGYNNQGLKDQVLALKWIKENIGGFGGDMNKITAFGQSAGGMTLDIQLLANEGLVQRAILQSGFALTPWVIAERNDSIPINIARNLGFPGENVKAAIEYLSQREPSEVLETANELNILRNVGHPITRPCVETVGLDALLTDFPINLEPKVKGMDIMIGHTNKEAMFMYPKASNTQFYESYEFGEELLHDFNAIYDEDIIQHFYIGDKADLSSEELQSAILDYATDFAFTYPAERSVERYIKAGAKRVYRYIFTYEGQRNLVKFLSNYTTPGACHGDELGYLFDTTPLKNVRPNTQDQKTIDIMTTMWTNFAKYGDPTPSKSDLISVDWPPAEQLRRPFMNFGKRLEISSRIFHRRMAFWDLYYKLHADKVKGYKKH